MNTIGMAPYARRKIKPNVGFPCKGQSFDSGVHARGYYTQKQADWMKANKPLYYTGSLFLDIHHLPSHLRFDA